MSKTLEEQSVTTYTSRDNFGPIETDQDLLRLFDGDSKATFALLYVKYNERMLRVAKKYLHDVIHIDAQDVVNESFTSLYVALVNGNGPKDNFEAYLVTVVKNRCKRHNSRNFKHSYDTIDSKDIDTSTPFGENKDLNQTEQEILRFQQTLLYHTFTHLPRETTYLLWKRAIDGVSISELSREFGMTESGMSSKYTRAKDRFRERYFQFYAQYTQDESCKTVIPMFRAFYNESIDENDQNLIKNHLQECTRCSRVIRGVEDASTTLWVPALFGPKFLGEVATALSDVSSIVQSSSAINDPVVSNATMKAFFTPTKILLCALLFVSVVSLILFGANRSRESASPTLFTEKEPTTTEMQRPGIDTNVVSNFLTPLVSDTALPIPTTNIPVNTVQEPVASTATSPVVSIVQETPYDLHLLVDVVPHPLSSTRPTLLRFLITNHGPNIVENLRGREPFLLRFHTSVPLILSDPQERSWTCTQPSTLEMICSYNGVMYVGDPGREQISFFVEPIVGNAGIPVIVEATVEGPTGTFNETILLKEDNLVNNSNQFVQIVD